MNELIKRSLIAIIAIPGLLFLYYYGQVPLLVFLIGLSLISAFEIARMLQHKSIRLLSAVISLSAFMCYFTAKLSFESSMYLLFLSMVLFGIEDVLKSKIEGAFSRFSASVWILLYCGMSFGLAYRIHALHNGNYLLPLIAVLIWITDSGAYFVGMNLGRHRGIFKVSPKKSIEGFIGGFLFSIIFALLAHYLMPDKINLFVAILMGIIVGISGQFGDLFESILKRDFGVKDSSNLIPGHGGILDRFDSFMIAVPLFYILYKILLER